MRDRAELALDVLDGRLGPPAAEDVATTTWIARVAQLADRGDYEAAAREAAELLEDRVHDIRLIAYYLFGRFLQGGLGELPTVLARLRTLVADELSALLPSRRKPQVLNGATAWLFENVSTQLQFHSKLRDGTWAAWKAAADGALPDAIAAGCTAVTAALEAVIEAPMAASSLARIRRWAGDELRRALARREPAAPPTPAPAPEVAPEAAVEAPADGDPPPPAEPAPLPAPARATVEPAAAATDPVAVGSPALAVLQTKLRGFQDLVARGELARAAIVAADVRAILVGFDPVAFFPSMFAGYFKTLHQVVHELGRFSDPDQPAWQALESYYRADLRAFLEE